MNTKLQKIVFIIFAFPTIVIGQNISLIQQFDGKYDFTFIGNTLNPNENSYMSIAEINTSSSAILNLNSNDIVEKAYLYWAGCGPGDLEVQLNSIIITPQRTFQFVRNNLEYFSAFAEITNQVQATGNGNYTLSELDLTPWINTYFGNRTNFGGWAIIIVYKNNTLPFNKINIYDGLQAVPNSISITLSSLDVVDNQNAKIGFLAWEGDENIKENETLTINGNSLGNPPLNPINNAFNGTNSITNNDSLFNMDLDIYDIQNNIQSGDNSATIQLTSDRDLVMINAIVTKLNAQRPDASIAIDDIEVKCNSREIIVHYTASNFGATKVLQAGVPIAIYINNILFTTTQTQNEIVIDGTESGAIILQIPESVSNPFDIQFVIDDLGTNQGIVAEIDEDNNSFEENVTFTTSDVLQPLADVTSCNEGFTSGTFDFSNYENSAKQNPTDIVTFYSSLSDLQNNTNPISNTNNYNIPTTPASIFVKVDNGNCFQTTSFLLKTIKCKPIIYNYVSANNDGTNDTFTISGLRDIFFNFRLEIYNRWGHLVWIGNNNTPNWDGKSTHGLILNGSKNTAGTYYYSLDLNDPDYPTPFFGYLFLNPY